VIWCDFCTKVWSDCNFTLFQMPWFITSWLLHFVSQVFANDSNFNYLFYYRWRRSFLFSLIFGLPVFAIFITYHVIFEEMGRTKPRVFVVPGLSLENLLMFLLCTPVQVDFLIFFDKICIIFKVMTGAKNLTK